MNRSNSSGALNRFIENKPSDLASSNNKEEISYVGIILEDNSK